jgi:hypothetical protein
MEQSGPKVVGVRPPPGTNETSNLSQFSSLERRGQNRLVAVLVAVGLYSATR